MNQIPKSQQTLSNDEFSAVLDAAADAMIVIDRHGSIERFNDAAEQLFGYSSDEVIGSNVKMLMPEPYRSQHDGYLNHHLTTGQKKIIGAGREVTACRSDGSELPVYLSVGRVDNADTPRFVGILRDVSETKQYETQIAQQRAELSRISRQATAGELAGALAHELNQPLSAIATYSGAAQRLLSQLNDEELSATTKNKVGEVAKALNQIESQSLRAGDVIQRMRAFIQPEETERDRVRIGDLVGEIIPITQLDARAEGVVFKHHIENANIKLDADKIQIQQVLLNLVRNAVDATALARCESPEVTLSVTPSEASGVTFTVKDTGSGIAPEFVDELFTPFRSTKKDGLGMGLAISRSIIENHGSKLQFRNSPQGCSFYFTLDN